MIFHGSFEASVSTSALPHVHTHIHIHRERYTCGRLDVARVVVVSVCSYAKRARDLQLFCQSSRLSFFPFLSCSFSRITLLCFTLLMLSHLSHTLSFTTSPAVRVSFSYPCLSLAFGFFESRLPRLDWVVYVGVSLCFSLLYIAHWLNGGIF